VGPSNRCGGDYIRARTYLERHEPRLLEHLPDVTETIQWMEEEALEQARNLNCDSKSTYRDHDGALIAHVALWALAWGANA
jgi:hypothetical protein